MALFNDHARRYSIFVTENPYTHTRLWQDRIDSIERTQTYNYISNHAELRNFLILFIWFDWDT